MEVTFSADVSERRDSDSDSDFDLQRETDGKNEIDLATAFEEDFGVPYEVLRELSVHG